MSPRTKRIAYLGWDVGAWHCDKGRSRDALVLLQDQGPDTPPTLTHPPWRGNLRQDYNESSDLEMLDRLLGHVGTKAGGWDEVVIAIDTPLGWPEAFHRVLADEPPEQVEDTKHTNAILLRQSEQWLAKQGYAPLSAVQDMIGSHSTKGLSYLLWMGLHRAKQPGVWVTPKGIHPKVTAIETYPTPCRSAPLIAEAQEQLHATLRTMSPRSGRHAQPDYDDALTCALMAWAFHRHPKKLVTPQDALPNVPVPRREGWIWVPRHRQ